RGLACRDLVGPGGEQPGRVGAVLGRMPAGEHDLDPVAAEVRVGPGVPAGPGGGDLDASSSGFHAGDLPDLGPAAWPRLGTYQVADVDELGVCPCGVVSGSFGQVEFAEPLLVP